MEPTRVDGHSEELDRVRVVQVVECERSLYGVVPPLRVLSGVDGLLDGLEGEGRLAGDLPSETERMVGELSVPLGQTV